MSVAYVLVWCRNNTHFRLLTLSMILPLLLFVFFRNSGLALLSRMATLFPAQMASRLRTLLDTVCAAAAGSEGFSGGVGGGARVALRQTQKAVQSVVPALKSHGAEAGVGAQFVAEVCSMLVFCYSGGSARICLAPAVSPYGAPISVILCRSDQRRTYRTRCRFSVPFVRKHVTTLEPPRNPRVK